MLKVGITGGIGSGKSIVSQIFSKLGVPVYYADAAAKSLMNESEVIRQNLVAAFGPEVYREKLLDRKWLAAKVFNDAEALARLNAIVHPVVIQHGLEWINSQDSPIVLKEAAIFFESGSYADMDYMIGVYAPQELRIARTMQRDGISREQTLDRMARQMNEEEKMKRCDYVITNDESELVIPQVLNLHQKLLELEQTSSPVKRNKKQNG